MGSHTIATTPIESRGTELAAGGFAPGTEVLTTEGVVSVEDLSPGTEVYALDPMTCLVKRKPVTAIEQVAHDGPLVAVETQRCALQVAPDHRILFRTPKDPQVRVQRAGDLHQRYEYKFINDWRVPSRQPLATVDVTEFLDDYRVCVAFDGHGHSFRAALPDGCEPCRRNSHTGYYFEPPTFKRYQAELEELGDQVTIQADSGHHRRPYTFDGDDFLRFLGWFATEGSLYRPADRNTVQITIAQETPTHRQAIRALFDRIDIDVTVKDRCVEFGSLLFGRLLQRLCGSESRSKRLPPFVHQLPRRQQRILFDVLIAGDGDDRGTFYTSSEQLATDIFQLSVDIGLKPRYGRRWGIWRIHPNTVNDGFQSPRHLSTIDGTGDVVQLSVADYPSVLAGCDGKFQWVGLSRVS